MINIDLARPVVPNNHSSVRIVPRGPRISPREAYAAEHIVVDRESIYRRRIAARVIPLITINGAPR